MVIPFYIATLPRTTLARSRSGLRNFVRLRRGQLTPCEGQYVVGNPEHCLLAFFEIIVSRRCYSY